MSSTSPKRTRALRSSRSHSNSAGAKTGSFTFGAMTAITSKNVSPCWPLIACRSASLCLLVGPLVDDRLDVAVPLPQWSRPVVEDTPGEPAQIDITELAAVNPHRRHALTVAVRGLLVEVARAAGNRSCSSLGRGPPMYQSVATWPSVPRVAANHRVGRSGLVNRGVARCQIEDDGLERRGPDDEPRLGRDSRHCMPRSGQGAT